jgi:hypothetical protein
VEKVVPDLFATWDAWRTEATRERPGDAIEGDIMKISLALAGTVLLAGSLTACGGGSDGGSGSDYCKDLKSTATSLGSLGNPDISKLDNAIASFHKLAAEAPGSIKDDWKTLDSAIATIQKAFTDAGLKLSDLNNLKSDANPNGVDRSKLAGLATQLGKLNTPKFNNASQAITAHAKKTCKVTLK